MPRFKRGEGERISAADAHTILGQGAHFSGKLMFEGALRIDGRFEGEVETTDLLLIGPEADVRGVLRVGTVIIHGQVDAEVHATESVEIKAPARFKGRVVSPNLHVERGVTFDGQCDMSEAPQEAHGNPADSHTEPALAAVD